MRVYYTRVRCGATVSTGGNIFSLVRVAQRRIFILALCRYNQVDRNFLFAIIIGENKNYNKKMSLFYIKYNCSETKYYNLVRRCAFNGQITWYKTFDDSIRDLEHSTLSYEIITNCWSCEIDFYST